MPSTTLSLSALLAQTGTGGGWVILGLIAGAVMLLFFGLAIPLLSRYKRCPSNRVLVIYGKAGASGQASKCIHGGAAFVVPVFQDYAWLSLEPIQIEVPLH